MAFSTTSVGEGSYCVEEILYVTRQRCDLSLRVPKTLSVWDIIIDLRLEQRL